MSKPYIKRCPACQQVRKSSFYRIDPTNHDRRAATCYECEAPTPEPMIDLCNIIALTSQPADGFLLTCQVCRHSVEIPLPVNWEILQYHATKFEKAHQHEKPSPPE